jgi:hypothetical protein
MGKSTPISMESVLNFLDRQGADRLPHGSKKTLIEHLQGTLKILSHWGQPKEMLAAGLLHSIYGTDRFRERLVPLSERNRVRQITGDSAERLIYLYGSLRRESLLQSVSCAHGTQWTSLRVECHRGSNYADVSRPDAGNLLVLYMAGGAEQTQKPGGEPGLWLAAVSQWGKWAKPLIKDVPPVFSFCSSQVSLEDEEFARESYLSGLQMIAENRGAARAQFAAAKKRVPWVAEPYIILSFAALLDGRWQHAFLHVTSALASLRRWGTAWDKRLDFDEWESIANEILLLAETGFVDPLRAKKMLTETVGDSRSAWITRLKSLSVDGLLESSGLQLHVCKKSAQPTSVLPQRFLTYMTSFAEDGPHPKRNVYPELRKEPVHPSARFPLAKALSASWKQIREEFLNIQPDQGFQNEIEKIQRTGNWTIFTLFESGKRNDANCARCPVTASIVERYAATQSILSMVYFSILSPGTHIAAHTGPTNMRLRCHLGIEVPRGCELRVADKTLTWREGKCLVFDDSFLHEVWNVSDRRRVILVVDLWHPDLSDKERSLIEGLHRYAYAHAIDLSGYWTKNEHARTGNLS